MKAKAIFRSNGEEIDAVIDDNSKYGMNKAIPESVMSEDDFDFRLKDVSYIYVNTNGNLNVCICGELWSLKYDKELHSKIKKSLNND
jgi:hypothetical protein